MTLTIFFIALVAGIIALLTGAIYGYAKAQRLRRTVTAAQYDVRCLSKYINRLKLIRTVVMSLCVAGIVLSSVLIIAVITNVTTQILNM